ncbi:unnamed protein product [Prorocentrum cordatum]|uniref:Uncharacterized protein n=1 Tax=Prorocentrum cordatum TaxID=2364126 RepID=A0ABN9X584_9DINO|nr:unnamed protein product [Polarella glacialis]|mmetsp:Transcript_40370/g.91951  ORF Transcript_40370/g.91951 Transcript_40370/m.91951 type:complete len:198 (-) Transcript_40370:110-703(-)
MKPRGAALRALLLAALLDRGAAGELGCGPDEVCAQEDVEAVEEASVDALAVELLQGGRRLLSPRSPAAQADNPRPGYGQWGPYMHDWKAPFPADNICVRCVGGFAMKFNLWNTATNRVSQWSPTMSAQRTECLNVTEAFLEATENNPISPRIYIKGAFDSLMEVAIQTVLYVPGVSVTADYTCYGSTTSFYCNLADP